VDIKQESSVSVPVPGTAAVFWLHWLRPIRQNKDLEKHFQKLDKDRSGSVTLATSCHHLGRMDMAQIRDLEIDPEISNKT